MGEHTIAGASLDETLWAPVSAAVLLRTKPQFDELVLDVCSGTGATALPTAELVGIGGLVDAVERDAALVEIARERAGERMPQLRFHVEDASSWETVGYDLVQCVHGVPFADADEVGRHLAALVKPGGRLAVAVWARGAFDPLPELLAGAVAAEGDGPEPDDAKQSDAEHSDAEHSDAEQDDAEQSDAEHGDTDPEDAHSVEGAEDPEADAPREDGADVGPGASDASGASEASEASPEPDAPGAPIDSAGLLARRLHELGLVEVRADAAPRHLDLDDDLAWALAVGRAWGASGVKLDALEDDALERVRERYLVALAASGTTRVDATVLVGVGRTPS